MVMNVEIISKETIKPSSPTPNHLKTLKLSFLDQIAPPVYVPIILFYHHNHAIFSSPSSDKKIIDPLEKSSLLKKSLSETLTRYYPLAGTIKEDFSIDCNDEGVDYYEAKITTKLSEVLRKPNHNVLNKFLPFESHGQMGSTREVLLAVQFNIFNCGSVAVGVCVSHKIGDGTSAITFVNAWANTSRGSEPNEQQVDASLEDDRPIFDAASYFPPRDLSGFASSTGIVTKEKVVTKRLMFDKSKICALKQEAVSGFGSFDVVEHPTRVEVVSAFLWKHFMSIARSKSSPAKVYAAVHAVNLRTRMVPPLPVRSFANLWRISFAPSTLDSEKEYPSLVSQLRCAIKQVDGDYVKKIQNGDEYTNSIKNLGAKFKNGEIEFCNFTSWCRFPVYEVDFGWGKPSWVCSPSRPFKNVVILMNTKDEDGIEAWVNMVEEDMALFESDPELISIISSSPPPPGPPPSPSPSPSPSPIMGE